MKNLVKMSVTKKILLLLLFFSLFSFSQKKKDVYFMLEEGSKKYAISYIMYGEKIGMIILYDRKEYEYYQEKMKNAKSKGQYYFDPESGTDNLEINVSKIVFDIERRKKVILTDWDTYELNRVDYKWLVENAGKPLCNDCVYDFKNIYFLYPIGKDKYMSYRVYETLISH